MNLGRNPTLTVPLIAEIGKQILRWAKTTYWELRYLHKWSHIYLIIWSPLFPNRVPVLEPVPDLAVLPGLHNKNAQLLIKTSPIMAKTTPVGFWGGGVLGRFSQWTRKTTRASIPPLPPLFSDSLFLLVHQMSVKLVYFMSRLSNLLMFIHSVVKIINLIQCLSMYLVFRYIPWLFMGRLCSNAVSSVLAQLPSQWRHGPAARPVPFWWNRGCKKTT